MKLRLLLLLASGAALLSCAARPLQELAREELFSIALGKMENQIDLFQLGGGSGNTKIRLFMRDGLFYVGDGNSSKVMEFSSYGDLIFLLYNPERNPSPLSLLQSEPAEAATTRKAVAFPLQRIGELGVDSEKRLYVEDLVSEGRRVKDKELEVLLDRVVLRFDRHGSLIDFIGQEGVGGTPFPYIEKLYVTDRDELVVICRTPRLWHAYWYSTEGILLYQVDIDQDHLPAEQGAEAGAIRSLGKIVPDRSANVLYLLVYDYLESSDDPAALAAAPGRYFTRIYALNLESGLYEGGVEVPDAEMRTEKVGTQEIQVPPPSFELLGVDSGGNFFLLRREDANLFQLLVLDPQGREKARRRVIMEDSELSYKEVCLSPTGILYALLGGRYEAKVVWWRSDRLLKEAESENR